MVAIGLPFARFPPFFCVGEGFIGYQSITPVLLLTFCAIFAHFCAVLAHYFLYAVFCLNALPGAVFKELTAAVIIDVESVVKVW